ncbi:MAG TPA: peptidoglycan editing factor PgeF [Vicinamibacterales bacterium]|nr:peptidoglycan editing factor PgeF [Vicinamibacterales bacterium]
MSTAVAAGFEWQRGPAGRVLVARDLAALAPHVFTTRELAFREPAAPDGERLARALDVDPGDIVRVKQVHGRSVATVRPGVAAGEPDADALVSVDPARAVAVRVADCVPILLADRRRRVVAAVHAGWRGTCAGVAGAAVDAIGDLGVAPEDLIAAIGPSVGPCCYQVDDKVRTAFLGMTPDAAAWFDEDGPGHWKLDLWRANADQLESAGLSPRAIAVARYCTVDHPEDCFSYRAEGARTGRMVAAIRLRK